MFKNSIYTLVISGCLLACGKRQDNATTTKQTQEPEVVTETAAAPQTTASKPTEIEKNPENPALSGNIIHRFVITKSQVGPVKIGMPIAQVKKLVPAAQLKEVSITKEGQGYKAYEIRENPTDEKPALLVEENCKPKCRVWRMHAVSPVIKTKEGLGIGSTLGEVRRFYNINYIGAGETEIVAVSERDKITFLLDVSSLPAKEVPKLNATNTPNEVKVIGMFVL